MLKNKNGITLLAVIIAVFVLVIIGGVGYCSYKIGVDKGKEDNTAIDDNNAISNIDNESNKNKWTEREKGYTNLNPELENLLTFNAVGDNLIAVTKEGAEIQIADLSENEYDISFRHDFYNDKVYLYVQKFKSGRHENDVIKVQPITEIYLAYIDLNKGDGNYMLEVITKLDSNESPESIAATSDALYIASVDMEVKKYSLSSNKFEAINIKGKDSLVKLDSTNIGNEYLTYNIGSDVYILNLSNNESKLIDNRSNVAFIYNGKVIYYKYGQSGYDKLTYYEYNINTDEKNALSNETECGNMCDGLQNIMPYNNDYIYVTTEKIIAYNNGNYKELYDFKLSIDILGRISEDMIYFSHDGPVEDGVDHNKLGTKTMDLKNNKVDTTSKNYSYIYTKYYEQK